MEDTNANHPPDNPFQSPATAVEEAEASKPSSLPDFRLIALCMLIGAAIKLGLVFPIFSIADQPLALGMHGVSGAIYGVGIALLIDAIARNRFSQLMPGHWRLIALSTTLITEGAWISVSYLQSGLEDSTDMESAYSQWEAAYLISFGIGNLLAAIFYGFVVKTTREGEGWRSYAWISLTYFGLLTLGEPLYFTGLLPAMGMGPYMLAKVMLSGVTLVIMLVNIALDLRDRRRRDVYHYIGILLVLFWWLLFPAGM